MTQKQHGEKLGETSCVECCALHAHTGAGWGIKLYISYWLSLKSYHFFSDCIIISLLSVIKYFDLLGKYFFLGFSWKAKCKVGVHSF